MIGKDVKLIEYSKEVDFGNCITHAAGAVMAAAALVLMAVKAQGTRQMLSAIIYGVSLMAVYTISSVYHGLKSGEMKRRARLADHSAIPILIAGTATPCAMLTLYDLSSAHCILVMVLGWFCAIFGFFSKMFFFEKLKKVTMAVYIVCGAAMLLSVIPLLDRINSMAFGGLVFGNVFYILGAICCGIGVKKPYFHVVFHVLVLIGSFSHFYVIYQYVF